MNLAILDKIKKRFDIDMYQLLDEVFTQKPIQDTMIEFNQDQLQAGFDSLNQKIHTIGGRPYRIATIQIKRKKNPPQPVDRVTLYDTGEFYKTFGVRIVTQGYEVIADFNKPDGNILDNIPGEFEVLGLDEESKTELVLEYVYPILYNLLRKRVGL